jgi:RNA polymerase sigma-70 factor (ECF subfamily)
MTQLQLVELARSGDQPAFEALARSIAGRLYRVAHRILRDPYQAEDAMQQALIAMWQDFSTLRDLDRFESWTYRLVVNAATSVARRDRRRQASVTLVPLDIGDEDPTGADASQALADRDALDRAFQRLSPEHRAVVVLRYFVGLPIEEIGRTLDIPAGTVASRLHHAMRGLRAALEAADRPVVGVRTA